VLSIPKGSLSDDERRQIEQHVVHTYNFLAQIPWTDQWKLVPRIAAYHHEKMDGSGYPNQTTEIPLQSRMMTISDIFDALTASDRPYKRAIPVERALSILETETSKGQLDQELFNIFAESKVFEKVLTDRSAAAGI
jgi:HD-GYP domain-containing protein (c-di-GMP phosphodiesterase class II)